MQIKAENLSYSYGGSVVKKKALKNINLEINEGEIFGIIGHTGSGKSTFIQHLNGIIKANKNSGKLTVDEYELTAKKYDGKGLRKKVGMVFQYPETQLFADTVDADVSFSLKNFYPDLTETERVQKVRNALNLVGLDYDLIKDKSPFELSGGQKRRIAIAGVIVSEPEILVLDEPIAGLDPMGKESFLELIIKLHNTISPTIILVSHDMNIVAQYCDRVAVFVEGEIIALGKPKEIFSKTEELKNAGLDLPVTAYISEKLNENGIKIDNDFTEEDFVSAVTEKYFGGNQ